MINIYAGNCANCSTRVEVGQGNYTPATKTLVHSQCTQVTPVAQVPLVRAFSIDRCTSLELFEYEVGLQETLEALINIRDIINRMNRKSVRHPLNHTLRGYGPAYGVLDKRAERLGFKPYGGGYYKPSAMVAVNPI